MADPYLGEIRILACRFAPQGWALCDGSQISIADNPYLYQLLGQTYGGDGSTRFGLPDLRGRLPLHMGGSYSLAQSGGTEQVQLQTGQLPVHDHLVTATESFGPQASPAGSVLARSAGPQLYAKITGPPDTRLSSRSVGFSGAGTPHDNMMPFLVLNFCIALAGTYPIAN